MADDIFAEWDGRKPAAGGKKPNGAKKPGGKKNGAAAVNPGAVASIRSAIVAAEPADAAMAAALAGDGCTMPPRFEMRDDGLFCHPGEGKVPFKISGPFKVLGEGRQEDNGEWSLLLGWHDRDGVWHEGIVPRRALAGDAIEVRARLAAGGLDLDPHPVARQQLIAFLAAVTSRNRWRTVPLCGWHFPKSGPPVFVLGARIIGRVAGEQVRLDIDPPPDIFRIAGTLDGWRAEVAARCVGNSRLLFAVSTAFAAPLIGLLGDEGGGLHFRAGSSRGKTGLLDTAASVYGLPSKSGAHSFVSGWNSTASGLETTAASRNDLILILDEISEADPAKLMSMAYMLGNGAGRVRMAKAGGNSPLTVWRTLVLSSGEENAASAVQQAGRHVKAGVEARLLDIPAEIAGRESVFEQLHGAATDAAFHQELRAATVAQHGTAGPAFIEYLVDRLRDDPDYAATQVAPRLRRWTADIVPPGADGQVQRAARRLALVAVGGDLATQAGITGWPEGAASAAAARIFRDWIAERGGTGAREDHHLAAALRRFIGEHRLSRFEPVRDAAESEDEVGAQAEPALPEAPRMVNLAGWRWQEVNSIGERVWVFGMVPEIFDAEIVAPLGMAARDARERLHRAGLIRGKREGGTLRLAWRPRRIPGHRHPRMIVIEAGLLSGEFADGD